ncbi:PIN domain-containing protein [Candidatus Gottesmanbacteria bacterium]|nr:PIN domain-containing protein [Candidatus Gottesmanbacteria bacterium]MBI5452860.1 PIN domain-containing protein [Candidatus Gottesmanbacteria bacterium]
MAEEIFLDSSFFKGLIDQDDDFHNRAESIWKNLKINSFRLVTTNYILDETFTLVRVKCGLEKVKKLRNVLSEHADKILVTRVTENDDARAWDWFFNDWSKLSFTDCVSFAVMKRLGLTRVATFDDHFKKAGFYIFSTTMFVRNDT